MKENVSRDIQVSICCLVYNHKSYIRKALDSFLMQRTSFAYEILINDDASTDGSTEIIREYEERYPDIIKPLYHQENQYQKGVTNPSGTYNFPRAKGKYIALCEGDDYWTDAGKLQKQFEYMQAHKDCSLCLHSAGTESLDGSFVAGMVRPYRKSRDISSEEIINKSAAYPTASLFFPTDLVRELPDFYFRCPVGDIPLQLILANHGYARYMDEPMSVYRIGDPGSWSVLEKQGDYIYKQERYFISMQNMYLRFDEYSEYRFTQVVAQAIHRIRFLTYVNTKKYSEIFSKEYKVYYRELDFRTRFFTRLEACCPTIYAGLRKMGGLCRRKNGQSG